MILSAKSIRESGLVAAKRELDRARRLGDRLRIELAEAALNDVLDREFPTGKTNKTQGSRNA